MGLDIEKVANELTIKWELLTNKLNKKVSESIICRVGGNIRDIEVAAELISQELHFSTERLKRRDIESSRALIKLLTLIKAHYFFIRSLQDNLNFLLRESDPELQSKTKIKSMGSCHNKSEDPLHKKISTNFPQYFPWFMHMRMHRNSMKNGVPSTGGSYTTTGDNIEDIAVVYHVLSQSSTYIPIEIKIRDIIESVEMSSKLLDLLEK